VWVLLDDYQFPRDCALSVIDTASNTVTGTLPIEGIPTGFAVDPKGGFVCVGQQDPNGVWVIDAATFRGVHAFTVGGIAVITLGMMARVSLGETGRALKVSNTIAIAFALINVSAVFRVLLPAVFPVGFNTFLLVSTYCWLAAFTLFVFIYTPILTTASVGSKQG